jgi:hypothetical protein
MNPERPRIDWWLVILSLTAALVFWWMIRN